ncbi:MAG: hypothetical protein QM571_06705 [Micrococcaceae bacterium]
MKDAFTQHVVALVISTGVKKELEDTLEALKKQTLTPPRTVVIGLGNEAEQKICEKYGVEFDYKYYSRSKVQKEEKLSVREVNLSILSAFENSDIPIQDSWFWFLPSGVIPEPEALTSMLTTLNDTRRDVAIVSGKLMSSRNREELVATPYRIGADGRQYQHYYTGASSLVNTEDSFIETTAPLEGALIKYSIWRRLKGFSPKVELKDGEADYCIRAISQDLAIAYSADAKFLVSNPDTGKLTEGAKGIYLNLKHIKYPQKFLVWFWGLLGAFASLFYGIIVGRYSASLKDFGQRLKILFSFMGHVKGSKLRLRRLSYLETLGQRYLKLTDQLQEQQRRYGILRDVFVPKLWYPFLALLLILGLTLFGKSLGHSGISGGALKSFGSYRSDALANMFHSWRPLGLGYGAPLDPFSWLSSFVSLFLGNLGWLVTPALYIFSFVLPAVTMRRFIRVTPWHNRKLAWFLIVLWAFYPSYLISLAEGRISGIVPHIVLPIFGRVLYATLANKIEASSTTVFVSAGVAMAFATAASPVLLITFTLILIFVLILAKRSIRVALIFVPFISYLFFIPLLITNRTNMWAPFADPDAQVSTPKYTTLNVMLSDFSVHDSFIILTAALLLIAVVYTVWKGQIRFSVAGWGIIVITVAVIAGFSHFPMGISGDSYTYVYPASSSSVIGFVLLIFFAYFTETLCDIDKKALKKVTQKQRSIMVVGLLILSLGLGTFWSFNNLRIGAEKSELKAQTPLILPDSLRSAFHGQSRAKALVLDSQDNGTLISSAVTTNDNYYEYGSSLYENRNIVSDLSGVKPSKLNTGDSAIHDVTAQLVSGNNQNSSDELDNLGIEYVVLLDSTNGGKNLTDKINVNSSVTDIGQIPGGHLWKVGAEDESAFYNAQLLDGSGAILQGINSSGLYTSQDVVDASPNARVLMLRQSANPRWKATLNGQELVANNSTWKQSFIVSGDTGTIKVWYEDKIYRIYAVIVFIVFLLSLIQLLPWPHLKLRGRNGGQ